MSLFASGLSSLESLELEIPYCNKPIPKDLRSKCPFVMANMDKS